VTPVCEPRQAITTVYFKHSEKVA